MTHFFSDTSEDLPLFSGAAPRAAAATQAAAEPTSHAQGALMDLRLRFGEPEPSYATGEASAFSKMRDRLDAAGWTEWAPSSQQRTYTKGRWTCRLAFDGQATFHRIANPTR